MQKLIPFVQAVRNRLRPLLPAIRSFRHETTAGNEHSHQLGLRHVARFFAQHEVHEPIHIRQVSPVVQFARNLPVNTSFLNYLPRRRDTRIITQQRMNDERSVGRQIRDGLSVVEIKSDDDASAELELLSESRFCT